jgi:hypothetical protein
MAFQVEVQPKGSNTPIYGPSTTKEEAEQDLAKLRAALNTSDVPDVSWVAIRGDEIGYAQVIDIGDETGGSWIE